MHTNFPSVRRISAINVFHSVPKLTRKLRDVKISESIQLVEGTLKKRKHLIRDEKEFFNFDTLSSEMRLYCSRMLMA